MDKIDFTKYNRLFVFGCSFTAYYWPTWADILGIGFSEYYNYGEPGHGNHYIFQQLVEAHARHKINVDDLVMIMWSSVTREDRYIINTWKAMGCVFQDSDLIENGYTDNYCSPYGFLVRDLGYISAAKYILDGIGSDYEFMSMNRIIGDEHRHKLIDESFHYDDTELSKLHVDSISCLRLSFSDHAGGTYRGIWCYDTLIRPRLNGRYRDFHPTATMYFEYLRNLFPETIFSNSMQDFVSRCDNFLCKDGMFNIDNWGRTFTSTLLAETKPGLKFYSVFNPLLDKL